MGTYKVLELLGIKMNCFYEKENVVHKIQEEVDSERFVIARIDEFYFNKCPHYQKEHLNYNILIYNYNDTEFNIVGMYKENGVKFTISYEEFLEAISNIVGTSHADGSYKNCGISMPIAYCIDSSGEPLFISKSDTRTRVVNLDTKESKLV